MSRKQIVAVVGRPNVGKSSLFNALAGKRISIVKDTPGVTRDRIYQDVEWLGRTFTVIDTGGIEPDSKDIILSQMREQAQIAIDTADVIIFLCDLKTGVTDADSQVADMLRKSGKPVVLTVNKVDNFKRDEMDIYEFYNLGIGDPVPISAVNSQGIGDLLEEVVKYFPDEKDDTDEDDDSIKVAVIGKPNVGKSSIINRLIGKNRLIVSDIAGTTRDAIDTKIAYNGQEYTFIDTAGIRRQNKIKEELEHFMIVRTVGAVERADVCVIVINADEGVTEQDAKIAGIAHENGKAVIVAVNKWDLIEKDNKSVQEFTKKVRNTLSFMPYCAIIFISAKTGQRLTKLYELIDAVYQNHCLRVATGVLNEVLMRALVMQQPPTDKGRMLKVFYMTQVSVKPPTFVVFVNEKKLLHFSYLRYLENQLRDAFGFAGTPIRFIVRERKGDNSIKGTNK
ncbi:ribosome biogenesis GTPase Der [Butyrivibrio sp. NC3005]|uniref:ribosome biogenesis GTPase Der n=1 Tax=Butyrivibrio sp. NC3005 TaxID=1280685 RepID=UPI000426247D|nr:ribosome biogenesis GTPase Der [Butyrivibrio sp. NC3005]